MIKISKKKFYIDTNACEEGGLDSARVKLFLERNDLCYTRNLNKADYIIFYACGLTNEKDRNSLKIIKELLKSKKPTAELTVWGCLSKINFKALEDVYNERLIGPRNINFFEELVQNKKPIETVNANSLITPKYKKNIIYSTLKRIFYPHLYFSVYYIRANRGCRYHCTYCSDRLSHGWIKSEPIKKIISQVKQGLELGYHNFFFVGSDLGSYGFDIGCTLPDLLNSIIELDSEQNYNLLLPNMCPTPLIEMYSDLESIFSTGRVYEIGCQAQSGSNRILKLMGRRYTIKEYESLIKNIDQKYPNIRLYTHFMVGFPTETEEDFKDSLKILDQVLYDRIDVFKYSDRPGIPSLKLRGKVQERVKKSRYLKMMKKAIYHITRKKIKRFFMQGKAQRKHAFIDVMLAYEK